MTKINGISMKFGGKTDIGRLRTTNQDNYYVGSLSAEKGSDFPLLLVVCDGMGGAAGGQTASELAVKTFRDQINNLISRNECENDEELLRVCSSRAGKTVYSKSTAVAELQGMGTTLVAALVREDSITVANVGDSRLYAFKNGILKQITHDHSFVQELFDKGQITKEQIKTHPNKNIITRALGVDEITDTDTYTIVSHVDGILLCSDGLSGFCDDEKILELFYKNESVDDLLCSLIDEANKNGGRDNITAVVLKFSDKEENNG